MRMTLLSELSDDTIVNADRKNGDSQFSRNYSIAVWYSSSLPVLIRTKDSLFRPDLAVFSIRQRTVIFVEYSSGAVFNSSKGGLLLYDRRLNQHGDAFVKFIAEPLWPRQSQS